MSVIMYCYPTCSTCKKAKKWFEQNDIQYEDFHIVEQTPTAEQLKELHKNSGLELKKFFNTSGKKYRELNLKDKVKTASDDELFEILASDGMLIKRPLVSDGTTVTVGFKEAEYEEKWNE